MVNFTKKGGLRQKGKGPTKRFSYGLMSRKPQDQELEKFLFHLNSEGVCKTSGRKGGWQSFVALRQKASGWGLCLNCPWREKRGLISKSTLISSLRGKTGLTQFDPQMKFVQLLKFACFTLFSCLSLRVKWITFFSGYPPTSANILEVCVSSQYWLFCFFSSL